ncbi:MAG TPA: hypothetical protein VM888_13240 [Chitinophagaceae bacterium]|jgi:hypothetical protein|nr:hypothetical protein [Chitinophagaceae bacterium]
MKVGLNKNRWLYRQSGRVQVLVLFIIFFIASIIGHVVTNLIFGDPAFENSKGLGILLLKKIFVPLLLAIGMVYFIQREKVKQG